MLDALGRTKFLTIEELAAAAAELRWNALLQAVDSLSRRGDIVLRRQGFSYQLSAIRPASTAGAPELTYPSRLTDVPASQTGGS